MENMIDHYLIITDIDNYWNTNKSFGSGATGVIGYSAAQIKSMTDAYNILKSNGK